MKAIPQYNEQNATVKEWDSDKKRWKVEIEMDGAVALMQEKNLVLRTDVAQDYAGAAGAAGALD